MCVLFLFQPQSSYIIIICTREASEILLLLHFLQSIDNAAETCEEECESLCFINYSQNNQENEFRDESVTNRVGSPHLLKREASFVVVVLKSFVCGAHFNCASIPLPSPWAGSRYYIEFGKDVPAPFSGLTQQQIPTAESDKYLRDTVSTQSTRVDSRQLNPNICRTILSILSQR